MKIKVFGRGKSYFDRQQFTDENDYSFVGNFKEAQLFFQQKYPSKTIIITCLPKKRQKWGV